MKRFLTVPHKLTHQLTLLLLCLLLLTCYLPVHRLAAQTATQTTDQIAVVSAEGATLIPEGSGTPLTLDAGALLLVKGRSQDALLLYVQTEARQRGWLATEALLIVNVSSLPVIVQDNANAEPATGDPAANPATAALSATLPSGVTTTLPTLLPTPTSDLPGAVTLSGLDATVTALVTLRAGRLNLRSGPGTAYPVVDKATSNSQWLVTGRDQAGTWLQLQPLTGGSAAWAAATYLQVSGAADALAVIAVAPPPAPVANDRVLVPTPMPNAAPGSQSVPVVDAAPAAPAVTGKSGLAGVLVFVDRIGGTIYRYDLGQDTLIGLTSGIDPALSPDGRRIAFTRDGGDGGLYVMNSDGSGEQRIYNDHPFLRAPSWSPDGRWLVFSRTNGFDDCRIVRGSVCLPDETILESLPEELQGEMEVHKLVKDLPNQRAYHSSLARIGPDGGDYRDIPALDYAAAPDWNSGGIVYQSTAGIQRTADESDVRSSQVANDPLVGHFHDPDWQPGGGRIVFHRKQGSHWQIYAVNPDGSGLAALTRPVTALVDELPSNVSPAWSPDGQHIVYVSNRNSIESAGAWHFWVMNADGSDQHQLPVDVVLDYTFASEQMVSWGPAVQ